jgi:hypothetical protein
MTIVGAGSGGHSRDEKALPLLIPVGSFSGPFRPAEAKACLSAPEEQRRTSCAVR